MSNPDKSPLQPTPRTDAALKENGAFLMDTGYVTTNFARQLERELAEAAEEAKDDIACMTAWRKEALDLRAQAAAFAVPSLVATGPSDMATRYAKELMAGAHRDSRGAVKTSYAEFIATELLRLASAPSPLAAPTDTYVQPVPDHCDRITWQGRYYDLNALRAGTPLSHTAPNYKLVERLHRAQRLLDQGSPYKGGTDEGAACLEAASALSATSVKYERRPELDKRIGRGDDFAGDAWVRYTAPGATPDDSNHGRKA